MILVKAQLSIAPDARGGFLQAMQTHMQSSRAESGCLSFACYEDTIQANAFIVLAEWADRASLVQHEASPHVAAFKAQIGGMIASREPTRVYTVSAVGGLDDLRA